MPIAYYIIPMTDGPYSNENQQGPKYVDDIACNWVGHNVDRFNLYVCLVNTTEEKHAILTKKPGVHQICDDDTWATPVGQAKTELRGRISGLCNIHRIEYNESETVGEFIMRIVVSGLLEFDNNTSVSMEHRNLSSKQREKIMSLCKKWKQRNPEETETVHDIVRRLSPVVWPGNDRTKINIGEF